MKKLFFFIALINCFSINANGQDLGTKIGFTYYDLQSQGSTGSRIVQQQNGKVTATWAESCLPDLNNCPNCPFVNLGAGYNHYNAAGWVHPVGVGTCNLPGSAFGVFSSRVESPQVLVLPSGKELVIGHDAGGLVAIHRPQAGVGGMSQWSAHQPISIASSVGNANAKAVVTGSQIQSTIHLIASCDACSSDQGALNQIRYYRSLDEGQTWDISDMALPDMSSAAFNGIEPESYALHAFGNTVAVVAGSVAPGNQWAIWKSTDNGSSWTKKVIKQFALADTVTSISNNNHAAYVHTIRQTKTIYEGNDKYHSVLVDYLGKVHVWSGYILLAIDRSTQEITPLQNQSEGIWYWNETQTQPTLIVNEREDIYPENDPKNFIGDGSYLTPPSNAPYGYAGLLSMPQASISPDGTIYLVYSGIVEGTSNVLDPTGISFRDLYFMKGSAYNDTWLGPINIATKTIGYRTQFEERIFPSVVQNMWLNNRLYLTYQQDQEPGLAVAGYYSDHDRNDIMFLGLEISGHHLKIVNPIMITVAAPAQQFSNNAIQLMPNPTSGITQVKIEIPESGLAGLTVTNLLGQTVKKLPEVFVTGYKEQTLQVDLTAQPSGTYLCTVVLNSMQTTMRLVKD